MKYLVWLFLEIQQDGRHQTFMSYLSILKEDVAAPKQQSHSWWLNLCMFYVCCGITFTTAMIASPHSCTSSEIQNNACYLNCNYRYFYIRAFRASGCYSHWLKTSYTKDITFNGKLPLCNKSFISCILSHTKHLPLLRGCATSFHSLLNVSRCMNLQKPSWQKMNSMDGF